MLEDAGKSHEAEVFEWFFWEAAKADQRHSK